MREGLTPIPMDITAEGGSAALAQRIREEQKRGTMSGALVASPHIDTIADKNGALMDGTGFEALVALARSDSKLLGLAILVGTAEEKARANKVIETVDGAGKIEVIDISERSSSTVTAQIAERFGVPYSNIGIGLIRNDENISLIKAEFRANGNKSASIVLIARDVVEKHAAQTAYVNVPNVICAVTAKGTSFLGLGIGDDDTKVITLVNTIKKLLGESFIWRLIRDVAKDLQNWINSMNTVSVAA
jgi:hypothetical protein